MPQFGTSRQLQRSKRNIEARSQNSDIHVSTFARFDTRAELNCQANKTQGGATKTELPLEGIGDLEVRLLTTRCDASPKGAAPTQMSSVVIFALNVNNTVSEGGN